MTAEEHAHLQKLEGLIKRYRSRIVTLKQELELAERRAQLLSELLDQPADDIDAVLAPSNE